MILTLILSLIMMVGYFLILFGAVAFIQNKKFFKSAPKDIYEAILEHEERFKGAHLLGYLILFVGVILLLGPMVIGVLDGIHNDFSLFQFMLRFLTMLILLELFDIFFFDLFLLCHSSFYQYYYPETKGCEGFKHFGFNWKSHLITTIIYIIIGVGLSFICMAIK